MNELLLVYRKFGIYVNYLTGIRTRHKELMWSSLPISTSYSEPYLFIYTEKCIDIYNVSSGIWLQSLPLSNTYPLTSDGSISLSYDPELDKNYTKLIYITEQNRLAHALNLSEKSSSKSPSTRDGFFSRSTLFNSAKSAQSSPDISISAPTGFKHIEHLGRDGRTIKPYLSQFSDEIGTMTDNSLSQTSEPSSSLSQSLS